MSYWFLLLILVRIINSNLITCPPGCNCVDDIVNCKGQGLHQISADQLPLHVKKIELQRNQLDSSVFKLFDGLDQLQYLDISNNRILSGTFDNLKNLKVLKLRKNRLERIPSGIEILDKLRVLDLRHNQIANLSANDLILLSNIENVDLGKNLISEWPIASFQTTLDENRLKSLNLASNRLSTLKANQFAALDGIQTLKLANNHIKHLNLNVFDGLNELRELDLSRNELKTISSLFFNSLRTLDRLNLDRNQLSNIQAGAFFGLENLRYLNFSSNRLDSNVISDGGFYGLDALEVLDLSNNNLNNLPDQVHTYLSQLTTLFLNGNQIQQLAGIKLNLPNLQFLSLASNGLSLIQVGVLNNLTSLIKLDLSNNSLASLIEAKSNYISIPSLINLNFSANNLRVLRVDAFSNFPLLKTLDLRNNPIRIIENGVFDGIKLEELFINTDSLNCDCNMIGFIQYLSDNLINLDNIRMKCARPIELKGQNLLEISIDSFICSNDSSLVRFIKYPQPLYKLPVGSTARISCSGYGDEPLTLEWKVIKDGSAVKLHENTNKFQTFINRSISGQIEYIYGEMEIRSLELMDGGDYQCSIGNLYGTSYLDPIKLIVQIAPNFILKPKDVIAKEGSNVLLECAAEGDPAPIITWDRNKQQAFPAAVERRLHLRESQDGIYLLNVSKRDEGFYTCHATNDAKRVSHTAWVKIIESSISSNSINRYLPAVFIGMGLGVFIGMSMILISHVKRKYYLKC